MPWDGATADGPAQLLSREWLVTNGLGGFASSTVADVATRRYHGLLIAALPAPLGRVVMLDHLTERLRGRNGVVYRLGGEERPNRLDLPGARLLTEFRLEAGLPVWRYDLDGMVVERRLLLPYLQNTVQVSYRLVAGEGPLQLEVRPALQFRPLGAPADGQFREPYTLTAVESGYEICADGGTNGGQGLTLRLAMLGSQSAFTVKMAARPRVLYRVEASRGYQATGDLWTPGSFRVDLGPDHPATLVASTESWETVAALDPAEALAAERERRERLLLAAPAAVQPGPAAELVLAADQFLTRPAGRIEDATRAHAAGDEARTVIAGYHWFTDWGRDTMISLPGLALATGREAEAGYILRTFARYIRDGLIPNLFPDGQKEGLYHTADATLWYFQALRRYLGATGDRETLRQLLPTLLDVVRRHQEGTRFGIGVDPADGLLRQGAEGYQLTWMDAKVEDWVVTPRRGKAVEINALWYNALRLLAGWLGEEADGAAARPLAELADQVQASFNQRFWYIEGGHLYDVVDGPRGNDPACRPNQLLAVSLLHPVLHQRHWASVVEICRQRLLTPVGLRSLAPDHPDYQPRYDGDLRARDAAYHQGTVWAWLIGPFIDAWLKVHPRDRRAARHFLDGLLDHLNEACLGSISEIFDAEPPYTPRGCIAQAWSVAETLRCWVELADQGSASSDQELTSA